MAKPPRGTPRGGRADGRVVPAAEFRATALAVIRQVHDTGKPVTVTSHGRPLVRVTAAERPEEPVGAGCMLGTCELLASEDSAFPPRTTERVAWRGPRGTAGS